MVPSHLRQEAKIDGRLSEAKLWKARGCFEAWKLDGGQARNKTDDIFFFLKGFQMGAFKWD